MNKNIKVAKELIKLAKSLITEKKLDVQTLIKLDEANAKGNKYILHHQEDGLWRIMACKDFIDVKKGDLGGLIQKQENLSHNGDCWVQVNARVYDNAKVSGGAYISDWAKVYGDAQVFDDAWVRGDALIHDNAQVYGKAYVAGNSQIFGKARVFGKARIMGNSQIHGKAKVDYDVKDEEITE